MIYQPADSVPAEVYRELLRLGQLLQKNPTGALVKYTVAPERPEEGDVAICDGVTWNPIGDGIKRPVWFDGTDWQVFA